MRIIAGSAKGRRLKAPKGLKTRPTGDRVREAVFNIIAPYILQARFLDLFAGSGAMGIEALSRGAAKAVFIESDRAAVKSIRENVRNTCFEGQADVFCRDVFAVLPRLHGAEFDLVYIDPPYTEQLGEKVLDVLVTNKLLSRSAIVMVETRSGDRLPESFCGLKQLSTRKYGDTAVVFFRKS